MATKAKLNTTAQGLGYRHRVAVERLFDALPALNDPRNPCRWCGRARHKDRTKNWDYDPKSTNPASGKLQGNHSKMSRAKCRELGLPIPPPDELTHGECNRQEGDGRNGHLAAGARGAVSQTQTLVMPWPW